MLKNATMTTSRLLSSISKHILSQSSVQILPAAPLWRFTPAATVTNFKPPKTYDHVEFPEGRRKLRMLEKVPMYILNAHRRPPKMQKRLYDMRGPEIIHNKLIHKQYGIKALGGGQLQWGHIEMIRNGINRKLIEKTMFAVWRIESPWKPLTSKGQGKRMGGGKGSIKEYVTPVKENRIIIEMGGKCSFEEVEPILWVVAHKLPFKAKVVSQEIMEADEREEQYIVENNINPFTFKLGLKHNLLNCRSWASPYDYFWHGKYR